MIKLLDLLKESLNQPKAILLAGAPGSGKGSILRNLNLDNFTIFNVDDIIISLSKEMGFSLDQKNADAKDRSEYAKAMAIANQKQKTQQIPHAIKNKISFILDGTSASFKQTIDLKNKLEDNGYKLLMVYVYTDLETSLKRNQERFMKSQGEDRSLSPNIVLRTWNEVTKNYIPYKNEFKDNFISISNTGESENIKDIEEILQTYIEPFRPSDTKPKSEKDQQKYDLQKQQLSDEIQSFISSNKTQEIINNSISKEEAIIKIKSFLNK